MMTQETEKVRKQMQMVCIDDLVPRNHLLRLIDKAIDWTFIYDLVRDTYSDGMGRPSIDPVTLIKIPLIQYLYGIKSMRQTIKEIEVKWLTVGSLDLNFMIRSLIFLLSGKTIPVVLKIPTYSSRFSSVSLRSVTVSNWLIQQRFLLMQHM